MPVLVFSIIVFVLSILFPNIRRNERRYSLFDTDNVDPELYIRDLIRIKFRRNKALKKCKAFLSKTKNTYKLKNKYVVVIMDTKQELIKFYNVKNRKHNATIIWAVQEAYSIRYVDNMFEEAFDNMCMVFNSDSTYEDILGMYRPYFKIDEERPIKEQPKGENGVMQSIEVLPNFFDKNNLLNINKATLEEITNLPGISIIMAKKTIQYRDLNSGFKTLDEFFKEIKIKKHFQEQLRKLICVKPYNAPSKENKSEERIVDF